MKRIALSFSVVVILLSPTIGLTAASSPPGALGNFSMVTEGVYRGARPTPEGLRELARLGVKTIINLQGGDRHPLLPRKAIEAFEFGERLSARREETRLAKELGMTDVNIPLNSLGDVTTQEEKGIDEAIALMRGASAPRAVFVHCEHGKDRTGLVVALFDVEVLGWDAASAHREMVRHGHDGLNRLVSHDMDEYFRNRVGN